MLKLLLREDRHAIRKDYFLRVFNVICLFLIALLATWLVFLTAAFLEMNVERGLLQSETEKLENSVMTKDRNDFQELSQRISEKVDLLKQPNFRPSGHINALVNSASSGISLSFINVSFAKDNGLRIEIQGLASRREDIVNLKTSLEQKPEFESVNLPFSNFAQATNIPFSMNIEAKSFME